MKGKFLLALVSMAAMFTGCNKENVDDFATGKQPTSFNVSVDGGVQTRADVIPPAEAPSRYVMEIYKGATAAGGTLVSHTEQATGTFTDVVLDNAQEYTVLFWADYGTPSADGTHPVANEYNASDLKVAKIAKQPTKAAFAGLSRFTVGTTEESVYTQVTLTHAVAQVNFKQTEALTKENNELVVKYPKSYSLNVDGNAVTEVAGEVTQTFTYNKKEIGTLGTSYIIAATSTPKTMLDITATLNGETAKAVSNVPFERNFRTNISGAYSDKYNATMKVTCEEDWGTPEEDVEIPEPSVSAIGHYYYDDNTHSATKDGNKTIVGIVCWQDPDNASKGKILSWESSSRLKWGPTTLVVGADSQEDGAYNLEKVKATEGWNSDPTLYGAFNWCVNVLTPVSGTTWYIPAANEVLAIATNAEVIDAAIEAYGEGTKITGSWWSSTEYSTNARQRANAYSMPRGTLLTVDAYLSKSTTNNQTRAIATVAL